MRPLIDVKDLTLAFDSQVEKNTLSTINFQLNYGESMLLLGPSGCGKSTLTFCLNGLYPRELDGEMKGDVFVNGKNTSSYKPGELSQHVGVVFQDPETQFCMLTVKDEVAFGLENSCVPYAEMDAKIDRALAFVNMEGYKEASIAALSGGQKQKLALACILALEPDLLILDEPTANLDPVATKDLIATIQRLQNELNCALLVIEHQLDGWTELADRCLLLNRKGTVFYDGSLRKAITDHLPQLQREGIWLPKVTEYVLEKKRTSEAIPLTIGEFSEQAYKWDASIWENDAIPSRETGELFLAADDITWSTTKENIIQNVSVRFYESEFTAIVGANGSGKTSLSRILAGIQKPTSGNLVLKGKALKNWKEAKLRQQIGYVFQNPEHQFITTTVFDEVAFSLQLNGVPENDITKRVDAALEMCSLLDYKEEHPYTLSQGQKRRLSVATMLIDDQQMLILDEPTFGQDAYSNRQLMNLLQQRHQAGTAIVMITHDMELVHQYASRVIVMYNGEVAADCKPGELWEKPAHLLAQWQLELPIPIKMRNSCERDAAYVSALS